jgi:hypothetical protein
MPPPNETVRHSHCKVDPLDDKRIFPRGIRNTIDLLTIFAHLTGHGECKVYVPCEYTCRTIINELPKPTFL